MLFANCSRSLSEVDPEVVNPSRLVKYSMSEVMPMTNSLVMLRCTGVMYGCDVRVCTGVQISQDWGNMAMVG